MRAWIAIVGVLGVFVVSVALAPASAAAIDAHVADDILTVDGGTGNDTIVVACSSGHVEVNGSRPGTLERCRDLRRILVFAGDGDERISLAGVTRTRFPSITGVDVQGEGGDDTVVGSAWADRLDGGSGTDSLRGGIGGDTFVPGTGDATIVGGLGDEDRVVVSGNANWTVTADDVSRDGASAFTDAIASVERISITAGPGDNVVDASGAAVAVTAAGARGDDTLRGGSGADELVGGAGSDDVSGGAGDDTLAGKGGPDVLAGGAGSDQLLGGGGRDRCSGGPGADSLVGC